MTHEKILTNGEIRNLRSQGVISESEIALFVGDLLVAENVLSKERRILQDANVSLSEGSTSKKLLRG